MIRAVLDTNVLISGLLFRGPPSRLVSAWQAARFHPVLSPGVLDEYVRVLAYPKFRLSPSEIRSVLEDELLPFVETVQVKTVRKGLTRDPDDAKFIDCALDGAVPWLVSGDADLLDLRRVESVQIVSVTTFLEQLRR